MDLSCTTPDGRECFEIVAPSTLTCSDGSDIEQVTLSYQNCMCDPTTNGQGDAASCEDIGDIVEATVTVSCVDGDGAQEMIVEPTEVVPAGSFTVTNAGGGGLPDKIDCTIFGPDGESIQRNVIDTSGDVQLELGDKFGALQLESCNDIACRELLCYNIEIENVGDVPMNVTVVDFTFTGQTFSLLGDVETNPLNPTEFTSLVQKFNVNICGGQEYTASINVEAEPPSGDSCQDEDNIAIDVFPPLPPTPQPGGNETSPPVQAPPPTASPAGIETAPPVQAPSSSTSPPAAPTTPPPVDVPVPSGTLAPGTATAPTEQCVLSVDFQCTITGDNSNAGMACDTPDLGIQPCLERPTGATMLFNGGGCDQSDNRQLLKFSCTDMNGGPPVGEGDQAYIVVTDVKGNGIIYFEGLVAVGEEYVLDDDGEQFEADQRILISTPDQSTVLQDVQYHSSCSSNLELKNRFGASQLVQFFNELQGQVTCFETFDIFLDVTIPFTIQGESVTLQTMTAMTNFAGFLDLTEQVAGQVVEPGGSVPVVLQGTLDLTVRQTYSAFTTITGIESPSGNFCEGMDFSSFVAGDPLPENIPTQLPTKTPTISPAPTTDPGATACSIEASITCQRAKNGRFVGSCEDIPDPTGVTCSNGFFPSALTFRYSGTETITVSVEARRETSTFVVNPNELFTAVGEFRDEAVLEIEGGETYSIDTTCDGDELTLGAELGPFEVVGFDNGDGSFTSVYPVKLSYYIQNSPYAAILDSALITSDFQPTPFDAVSAGGIEIDRGQTLLVFEESTTVDALEKFGQGVTFNFAMTAEARGAVSDLPCTSEATLSF